MRHDKAHLERLAAWRELSQAEQSAIREHAEGCSSCSKQLALYEQQDRLLSGLLVMTSRVTFADVRERIAVRRAPLASQRAWAVAFMLLLFLGLGAGSVAASGDAIPGDLLYPVKLSVEATRRTMARNDATREELDARFAEQRRIEAQALLSSNRSAEMNIEGELSEVQGSDWTLSGLQVTVPHEIWQGEPPAMGQRIEMRVEISSREMRALAIQVDQREGRPEEPGQTELGPTGSPAALGDPAVGPTATSRGAVPSDPPAATREQSIGTPMPQPTGTPMQLGTATHGIETPGPVPTQGAGAPAIETAVSPTPGPTGSPELGPVGPVRTPTGPQEGQQGGSGR
ncbi:MAG: hypothetical protein R6X16_05935 [Anaerolineae bacterium]